MSALKRAEVQADEAHPDMEDILGAVRRALSSEPVQSRGDNRYVALRERVISRFPKTLARLAK